MIKSREKVISMLKKKLCKAGEGYELYEYKPTIRHPFLYNYERLTLQRRVRFLFEFFKGYRVYYLVIQGEVVAYSVVSKGGGRYQFARKNDIVVGPYFVLENHRGKRYSETLVRLILHLDTMRWEDAYEWIRYDNIPSIRCAERVGFIKIESMDMIGLFRKLHVCKNHVGDYWLFKYRKK